MAGTNSDDYVWERGGRFYYKRRVPVDIQAKWQSAPKNGLICKSLKTTDKTDAYVAAKDLHEVFQQQFAQIRAGLAPDADAMHKAISVAQSFDLKYTPAAELAKGSMEQLLQHAKALASTSDDTTKAALLGTVKDPGVTISKSLERFFKLKATENIDKDALAMRKWGNPRRKAARNFISVVGDKPLFEVTRRDVQQFYEYLEKRVLANDLKGSSANKELIHMRTLWKGLSRFDQQSGVNPFLDLNFPAGEKEAPSPWTDEQLLAVMQPGAVNTSPDRLGIVLAMIETGARPIELINLQADDICTTENIPHIKIRPRAGYKLKTPHSKRDIPLLGVSLEVFRQFPNGFDSIKNPDAFSAVINKQLREAGILSQKTTLYGIRHRFKERMRAASIPERMQEELMGHTIKSEGVVYGGSAPLEQTAPVLAAMALPLP